MRDNLVAVLLLKSHIMRVQRDLGNYWIQTLLHTDIHGA